MLTFYIIVEKSIKLQALAVLSFPRDSRAHSDPSPEPHAASTGTALWAPSVCDVTGSFLTLSFLILLKNTSTLFHKTLSVWV